MIALNDTIELFNAALGEPKGLRVSLETEGHAKAFRHKLNRARAADRKLSLELYEPGDPRRGSSVWDQIVIRLEGADVLLEKSSLANLKVSPL